MFDDESFGFEAFLLLGVIFLFTDYMEKKEREFAAGDPEYAANEARALGLGCLMTIGLTFGIILMFIIS